MADSSRLFSHPGLFFPSASFPFLPPFLILFMQAGLGLVTRTLTRCSIDLVHFFLLFSILTSAFAMIGYALLGQEMGSFATVYDSFTTTYQMVLFGDNSIFQELDNTTNKVAALLWFYVFTTLCTIILMNVLLAIIVEGYLRAKEDSEKVPTSFFAFDPRSLQRGEAVGGG